MHQHVCPQCGNPFLDKRPHAKYCGNICRGQAKRTLPEIPCERCGSLFRPKDQTRFCSRACYDADRVEQSEQRRAKTCAHCGNPYTLPYGYAETIYCSRRCSANSQITAEFKPCPICGKEFKVTSDARRHCSQECYDLARKRELKICPVCNVEFAPKRSKSKYCSQKCKRIGRRTITERSCPTCGKIFRPRYNWIRYCSRECGGMVMRKLHGKKVRRSGHDFTRHQKNQILERDNYCCALCGSDMSVQVDHVLAVGLGGSREISNGQTLCHDCHSTKTTQDRATMRSKRLA